MTERTPDPFWPADYYTVSQDAVQLADPPRLYPIETLTLMNVRVFIMLAGAIRIVGWLGRHPETRQRWWFAEGKKPGHGQPLAPWISPGVAIRLRRETPMAWAPLEESVWTAPLPEPIGPTVTPRMVSVDRVRPGLPPPEVFDAGMPDDVWPYPGLKLGERGIPQSLEECEARVLRGFRTQASRAVSDAGHKPSPYCADIPAEFVKLALRHADIERLQRGEIRAEDFEAVRSGWSPTRRDLGDWDHALAWLAAVSRHQARVIALRAANPVYSWRQIADRLGGSHETARVSYRQALEAMFARAIREEA